MRPHIIISSAMSLDGKLARADRKRLKLSNELDIHEVDELRAGCDAILVGSVTMNNDDPSLLLKDASLIEKRVADGKPENPLKIAISRRCDMPLDSKFFLGNSEKLIFTTSKAKMEDIKKISRFADVIVSEKEDVDVIAILEVLEARGIKRLIVEGGGRTNALFLNAGVVDEMRIAVAPIIIGQKDAPGLCDGAELKGEIVRKRQLGDMVVIDFKVK